METPPFEITHAPSFAMLRVDVPQGQTLVAEAGAMVARTNSVGMEVKLNASPGASVWDFIKALFVAFLRKVIGGETFFVNHFTSAGGNGRVWLAPTVSGSITHRKLTGQALTLSTGAFVACSGAVDTSLKFGGLRGILAREGAFFLQVSGQGDVWFNSYGGIHAIDVNGSYIVDTGHLVGFEGNLDMDIRSAGGGAMGLLASGEGLVIEFRGQGRVYIQSRNLSSLVGWVSPLLP